ASGATTMRSVSDTGRPGLLAARSFTRTTPSSTRSRAWPLLRANPRATRAASRRVTIGQMSLAEVGQPTLQRALQGLGRLDVPVQIAGHDLGQVPQGGVDDDVARGDRRVTLDLPIRGRRRAQGVLQR